ncbi:alpha-ketoglutarate-dependent dioxygenase AlkB [Bdellovibrio bacteriovorus]|uniref:Alpha-ketoglutarate-dependent dioxygenase AlkB n=1 Tax=Bdellovibrio bacteriovorus TaxID=959 RepID=A0A1Z3NBF2_BDEBC|nr:alpha-ketoglutarate-dependent dioxygenase AlkB [Bdellovibrio bacteriovorus]ASD64751.1 alpha-ketoglutarate-dependent dioxygenase AlkB [Bdellovibrio bacteriovorus]
MFKPKGRFPSKPAPRSASAGPKKGGNDGGEKALPYGLIYKQNYISAREKAEIMTYLKTLYPIWEMRYSKNNPPPENQKQRPLLRPVYWLGNWQFACLNYYHPPKGIYNRCVTAEGYPPILEYLIQKIEALVHDTYAPRDIPRGWHLNTCLINYYGDQIGEDGKKNDCARVGEHKDFEPGPVASISFGERAFFQFVSSQGTESKSNAVFQQWLDDSSLQIFGGDKFKKHLFHRVQRVDRKSGDSFPLNEISNFETRRINFTFRYVPDEHITPFHRLSAEAKEDVQGYVEKLAEHSDFFRDALTK